MLLFFYISFNDVTVLKGKEYIMKLKNKKVKTVWGKVRYSEFIATWSIHENLAIRGFEGIEHVDFVDWLDHLRKHDFASLTDEDHESILKMKSYRSNGLDKNISFFSRSEENLYWNL